MSARGEPQPVSCFERRGLRTVAYVVAEHVRRKGCRLVSAPCSPHDVQSALGIEFADHALLRLAMTHPSYTNEHEGAPGSFERLEFLGDAVLGMVIAERLYERFPTSRKAN